MADIDVVPKRSSHLWMWIIIAIVLLAVIWAVVGRGSNTNTPQGQLLEPHNQSAPIALLAMRT